MYYYVGWDGEWSNYEESRRFVGKRKQDIRIIEREVQIVADQKGEEGRSLGAELKALEKAVSAGFPLDAAASDDDAGRDIGIVNKSAPGAAQQDNTNTTIIPILAQMTSSENSSSAGTGRTWLLALALTCRLLSGSGGGRSVCALMLRRKCALLMLGDKGKRDSS